MKIKEQIKEYRGKNIKVLLVEIEKLNKKLRDLRFGTQFKKTKDITSIAKTKKTIARVSTIISEKIEEESSKRSK